MDRKLKHLDFIQGVINRLSTNSFLLKGWSVVLISALFALSASDTNVRFVFLAYIPAIAFWGLDGYFLAMERAYRKLYDEVRTKEPDDINFSMSVSDVRRPFKDWLSSAFSSTILIFHVPLMTAIVVVTLIQW